VDEALWARLAPVLTLVKLRKQPGRPRCNDRPIFNGLIWLARTGGQWASVARRFGPQSTVHDRFQEWVAAGALQRAWALLLADCDEAIGLDWEWPAADGCIIKAPLGKRGRMGRRRRPGATRPTGASAAPSGTR
jgi:transposase